MVSSPMHPILLSVILIAMALPAGAHGRRGPDKAPALGAPIPKVSAKSPDGKTTVELSQPRRHTVLIFGSHT